MFAEEYCSEHDDVTIDQVKDCIRGYWTCVKHTFPDNTEHRTRLAYLGSFVSNSSYDWMYEKGEKRIREQRPYDLEYWEYMNDIIFNKPELWKHRMLLKDFREAVSAGKVIIEDGHYKGLKDE